MNLLSALPTATTIVLWESSRACRLRFTDDRPFRLLNKNISIALQDMADIASYISHTIGNPIAAEKLAQELVQAIDSVAGFPYRNAVYILGKPLGFLLSVHETYSQTALLLHK